MSWSASFKIVNGDMDSESLAVSNVALTYHADQFEHATRAAWNLVRSGAFGNPEGNYSVNISGHGNPDHVPLSGWSNDSIMISVYQV